MTAELGTAQVVAAVKRLEELVLPEQGLCKPCQSVGFCQLKSALIATPNLGKEGSSHFSSLLKPHNGNFHANCGYVVKITDIIYNA